MRHSRVVTLGPIAIALVLFASGCSREAQSKTKPATATQPPIAATRAYQVPSPHGSREDVYYWLRDDTRTNKDMFAYLNAENAYTDAMLAHTKPLQEKVFNEIVGRIKQDDATVPFRDNGYWYYRRFETGKEYPIWARKRGSLDAPEQIMLDVNRMAEGHGFFQVAAWEVSPDGKWLAWAEDNVGRRQYTLRVKVLGDAIANVEPMIAWAADRARHTSGFCSGSNTASRYRSSRRSLRA